jgi:hypothetical protein
MNPRSPSKNQLPSITSRGGIPKAASKVHGRIPVFNAAFISSRASGFFLFPLEE